MKTYIRKCYNSSRDGRVNIAGMETRHLVNASAKKITGMKRNEIANDREMVALLTWMGKRIDEIVYNAEDRSTGKVKICQGGQP